MSTITANPIKPVYDQDIMDTCLSDRGVLCTIMKEWVPYKRMCHYIYILLPEMPEYDDFMEDYVYRAGEEEVLVNEYIIGTDNFITIDMIEKHGLEIVPCTQWPHGIDEPIVWH